MFSLYLKCLLCFWKEKIILFICFHNITKGQDIIPCPYIVVFRAILFLTHVLLYTLFVLSQVECKQFVSFLSLLENDERCAEWNTTMNILSCFCKSATGCVVCVNRAAVNIVVSHIDYPGLSPGTDCMLCTIWYNYACITSCLVSLSRPIYGTTLPCFSYSASGLPFSH